MDFTLTPRQREVRALAERLCRRFDDAYWLEQDRRAEFPEDFYRAVADAGLLRHRHAGSLWRLRSRHRGSRGADGRDRRIRRLHERRLAVHMNIFGLNPVVVFGSDEQKRRMLPPLIRGEHKACFAVTEPDAGLNTAASARAPSGAAAITCCPARKSGFPPPRWPTRR